MEFIPKFIPKNPTVIHRPLFSQNNTKWVNYAAYIVNISVDMKTENSCEFYEVYFITLAMYVCLCKYKR